MSGRACLQLFAMCFLLVIMVSDAGAEVDAASLEIQAPSTAVSIGDRIEARVLARGGEDILWGEARVLIESEGPWEVVDGPSTVTGSQPPAWKLTLVAMEVGEIELPTCVVSVRSLDGIESEIRVTKPPTITVASVLVDENETEPSPLKDPVGVTGFPWEWAPPIVAVLVPLLILGLWWWRRRQGESSSEHRSVLLPPIEELVESLNRLRKRLGRDTAEGCCDQLAHGVRRYLERRSGEPAMDMTSSELRLLSRRLGWPDGVQRGVQRAMGVADSVRFGKRPASEAHLLGAIDITFEAAHCLESHLQPQTDGVEAAP